MTSFLGLKFSNCNVLECLPAEEMRHFCKGTAIKKNN